MSEISWLAFPPCPRGGRFIWDFVEWGSEARCGRCGKYADGLMGPYIAPSPAPIKEKANKAEEPAQELTPAV